MTTINGYAFGNCSNLKQVNFGTEVKSINNNAFGGCTSLSHIKIPKSISNFGQNIFVGCTKLTKAGVGLTEGFELESGITVIPSFIYISSL